MSTDSAGKCCHQHFATTQFSTDLTNAHVLPSNNLCWMSCIRLCYRWNMLVLVQCSVSVSCHNSGELRVIFWRRTSKRLIQAVSHDSNAAKAGLNSQNNKHTIFCPGSWFNAFAYHFNDGGQIAAVRPNFTFIYWQIRKKRGAQLYESSWR